MNYDKTQLGNSPSCEAKSPQNSSVESALDNITGRVNDLSNLAEDIINLIQSPQPIPCEPATPFPSDPNLAQIINRIGSRADDTVQRLALVVDIIRQNLGGIKLD